MTIPWALIAAAAIALGVGLLWKRYGPKNAQGPHHPLWWIMMIAVALILVPLALSSFQNQ